MSALLETPAFVEEPPRVGELLHEQISDWSRQDDTAQAAAEVIAAALKRPLVTVLHRDRRTDELVLLGAAPAGREHAPRGSRRKPDRTVGDLAIGQRRTQRSLDVYVEPDFVRSLPGEKRSALAVPVCAGKEVLGVIHLEYAAPQAPSDADQELVEEVAAYLAVAWNASAQSSVAGGGRIPELANILTSLTTAIAQSDDPAAVVHRIPAAAIELLGSRGAVILRRHASRHVLEVVSGAGSLEIAPDSLVPLDSSRLGGIFRKGQPVEVSSASDREEPLFPLEILPQGAGDSLVVPVSQGGQVVGLLVTAAGNEESRFGSEDVRILQTLADYAGAADALRAIGPLRQKISDASLIAEVGRAMTGTLGADEVLAVVVRSAEMLLSGRCAGVALLTPDHANLVLVAASGSLQAKVNAQLATRESVVGWVAINGENLITDSLSDDPRGWDLGAKFGPAALVPLESRGQIRGVLFVARAPGHPPISDYDLDAVRKLGAYAAIAIENARLYQEQTELSATLKKQAQELERTNAELHTSQERLLVSEKMAALGRVTAGIAHEINSPLGSILNCLQLATTYADEYHSSAGDPEVTPDDHRSIAKDLLDSLKLAEDATRRVAQFVRSIKGQTRMEEERVELFDPAAPIESTMLMLAHELTKGTVTLESDLSKDVLLRGDPNKFALIAQNLISNAVDAYAGGEGVVHIRFRKSGSDAVLEVEDRGCGIPEAIRPRIYDYLFTTKDVGHGTGLGLSLVHSVVTSHFHGKVEFKSELGSGTTFVVTIPLPKDN